MHASGTSGSEISIHAPREGSDRFAVAAWNMFPRFLSTLPARGATLGLRFFFGHELISIHAPREGSDHDPDFRIVQNDISIHAPREGSDNSQICGPTRSSYFYPRSPRGERRRPTSMKPTTSYFYPRSPRGERLCPNRLLWEHWESLSKLPARGATSTTAWKLKKAEFLSTLPARGATKRDYSNTTTINISIHAPREGSDVQSTNDATRTGRFLSTLPARGATPSA